MKNRQLRSWVFMLYPDNPKHEVALNYLDLLDNVLYIKHIAKVDENGNQINKEHYHVVMRFDNPYYLSVLLRQLGLDEEDEHLFHSFKDFLVFNKKGEKVQKYKTLYEYINYLDHMMEPLKSDKYEIDDFHGGLKWLAVQIILNRDKEKHEILLNLCSFVKEYNLEHWKDTRYFTFDDWFRLCNEKGYGEIFYREWSKMRDILRAYIIN